MEEEEDPFLAGVLGGVDASAVYEVLAAGAPAAWLLLGGIEELIS